MKLFLMKRPQTIINRGNTYTFQHNIQTEFSFTFNLFPHTKTTINKIPQFSFHPFFEFHKSDLFCEPWFLKNWRIIGKCPFLCQLYLILFYQLIQLIQLQSHFKKVILITYQLSDLLLLQVDEVDSIIDECSRLQALLEQIKKNKNLYGSINRNIILQSKYKYQWILG